MGLIGKKFQEVNLLKEVKILQNEVGKLKSPYVIDEINEKDKNIQISVANILTQIWIKQQNEIQKQLDLENES